MTVQELIERLESLPEPYRDAEIWVRGTPFTADETIEEWEGTEEDGRKFKAVSIGA
jgi:hypothetical protein